jgi:dTDP-4-dehydrorhamnose 3,5-epimerase-like enzyme
MNIKLLNFPIKGDSRGSLIALEENREIPFEVKRVYYIYNTKKGVRRGFHAHKSLLQVAVCVHGRCKFLLDDGRERKHIVLDRPDKGLFIDVMIWREMYDFSQDCVLMVLASDFYFASDYIQSYEKFLEEVNGKIFSPV